VFQILARLHLSIFVRVRRAIPCPVRDTLKAVKSTLGRLFLLLLRFELVIDHSSQPACLPYGRLVSPPRTPQAWVSFFSFEDRDIFPYTGLGS
jgi:hypothetical protein